VITYRPRSAMRDVGKALGLDPQQVDRSRSAMQWWDGRERSRAPARGRLRPGPPAVIARLRWPRADRLPAASVAARRRLRDRARPARSELVPVENAAMPESAP
jgi:error-prone DNA polymerase